MGRDRPVIDGFRVRRDLVDRVNPVCNCQTGALFSIDFERCECAAQAGARLFDEGPPLHCGRIGATDLAGQSAGASVNDTPSSRIGGGRGVGAAARKVDVSFGAEVFTRGCLNYCVSEPYFSSTVLITAIPPRYVYAATGTER
jgi:hypothetical protein